MTNFLQFKPEYVDEIWEYTHARTFNKSFFEEMQHFLCISETFFYEDRSDKLTIPGHENTRRLVIASEPQNY